MKLRTRHDLTLRCLCRIEALRREKAGAEERAVLAAVEKSESERAAAEQLEDAHRQNEDLAEVSNHPCLLCNHASHVAG